MIKEEQKFEATTYTLTYDAWYKLQEIPGIDILDVNILSKIYALSLKGECTISNLKLADIFCTSEATIKRHMKHLRDAGLIKTYNKRDEWMRSLRTIYIQMDVLKMMLAKAAMGIDPTEGSFLDIGGMEIGPDGKFDDLQ